MREIKKSEVMRYLGYRKKKMTMNKETDALIDQCIEDIKKVCAPHTVYKRFSITRHDGLIDIAGMLIKSRDLSRNLKGCDEVFLFAATAGLGIDRLIRKTVLTSMSKAAIYQAAGAEAVECICDNLNDQLRELVKKEGLNLKPRFSPGYGDTSLLLQKDFERLLQMSEIGIHLTDTLLMVPSKSVTAFVGISKAKTKVQASCQTCDQQDCPARRDES